MRSHRQAEAAAGASISFPFALPSSPVAGIVGRRVDPAHPSSQPHEPGSDVVNLRPSGDGFLRCGDGHIRWGVYGAAGVVFVHRDERGEPVVMLQKRSAMAHEGGTWSCAGGALDLGETPLEGGLREASEEVGAVPAGARPVGEYVFQPSDDWRYTTVVVEVPERFGSSVNFETDDVGWFTLDEVDGLSHHAGFASAWPHLRTIIEANTAT